MSELLPNRAGGPDRGAARRAVVAAGDVESPACHGGIPHAFLTAARRAGFAERGGRVSLEWAGRERLRHAALRLLTGRRPGGFQYSDRFLRRAEAELPPDLLAGEIVSFSQHFPRAATVRAAGGRISYYLDATAAGLLTGRGLDLRLPPDVAARLRATERENYALADRVVFRARWAAASAVEECGADPAKVSVILPGANLDLPAGSTPAPPPGAAGVDRPVALGFVGKDWARKGLPVLCDARDELERRGVPAVVRAAGFAPKALADRPGVEFVGFLDKRTDPAAYPRLLAGCDVGCLFSSREALGLSVLEFLRAGVPVAGFAAEGPAETLPADAGVRFPPGASAAQIADGLAALLTDPGRLAAARRRAAELSPSLTWDRCLDEFRRLWTGERFEPFRLTEPAQDSG